MLREVRSAKIRPMSPPVRLVSRSTLGGVLLLVASTSFGLEMPFLLDLPPNRTSSAGVRYTPGSLDRASHVQQRLSLLARDFARWSGGKETLQAYLLSRQEWEELGVRIPYGLPARLPDGGVVLSAWGDSGTVALWTDLLAAELPAVEGTPLRGTAAEASTLLALDLLAQVEVSRTLVVRGGYRVTEPRIADLLAHTLAATAFWRHEAARFDDIGLFFARLARTPVAAEGSVPEEGLRRLLRRQARTFLAAHLIVRAREDEAAKALLKLAAKQHDGLGAEDLRRKFPEITSWLDGD